MMLQDKGRDSWDTKLQTILQTSYLVVVKGITILDAIEIK